MNERTHIRSLNGNGGALRLLIGVLGTCALLMAAQPVSPAQAFPGDCPPFCDRIPDSAWIAPQSVPLYDTYRWPDLAPLAVAEMTPRLKFEEDCATPPVRQDPRDHAVAARATVAHPAGDWQLQVQVMHWRGETWRSGETAMAVLRTATDALRACPQTAPRVSPTITADLGTGVAAVISIDGERVLREYLVADPRNGTVVELAMWASSPPRVPWRALSDVQVLAAMAVPLCTAYIDSCR